MADQPSLLDDLGEEVTGIIAPVSLCMAVTVLLVRLLNPEGVSSANTVIIASIAYQEQSADSSGKKFGGALLNAVIFVGIVAGMTIILFLLFKYKCYKIIYAYMGFAIFNIFFFLTGAVFIQVMQVINLHIDAFSLAYGLFNFSVVGTVGLLIVPIPLLAKQVYLTWTGIITAYIFTFIPEWTTWVILVMMAIYDIVAVLIPGGPLKALVELAIERKEELPALIYEARPAGGRPYVRGWGNRAPRNGEQTPEQSADGQPPPQQQGGGGQDGGAGAGPVVVVSGSSRPVAEGSGGSPPAVEMRRPSGAHRFSTPPPGMPVAVVPLGGGAAAEGGGSRKRTGSGGGGGSGGGAAGDRGEGPVGGWAAGRSRLGQQSGSDRGDGAGSGAVAAAAQTEMLGSFNSRQSDDWRQPQGQPRRLPGGGGGGSGAGRPVGEGREDDEYQSLPADPSQGTLRGRLARVLSGSRTGPGAGGGGAGGSQDLGRVTPSSHTSQEPLIDAAGRGAIEPLDTDDDYSFDKDRRAAAGAAGPSNPTAVVATVPGGVASSKGVYGSGGKGYGGYSGFEDGGVGKGGLAAGGSGGSYGVFGADGTMGVRPVAPAIGSEQLAAAARRSGTNTTDLTPSAATPPAPMPGPRRDNDEAAPGAAPAGRQGPTSDSGSAFEVDLPDAIKLGLGDFIFYSLLVGRAAMYDFMTVFSSYLAIIAGLGLTLLCLAIFQKALPALPFSIALGVLFYFLTRLTLEPFLVPLAVNMAYF